MRRHPKELFSLAALKNVVYIPLAIFKMRNWFIFLLNYIGLRDSGDLYVFRDGTKIVSAEGIDSATIKVVYLNRDYGEIADHPVIIDIGANIGVFSVFAGGKSKTTRVYAYEPAPRSYKLLLENIRLNRLEDKVSTFPLGVAGARGKRRLILGERSPFHSLYSSESGGGHLEVDCVTLKDVFDENRISYCDILKLDCEGAEFEILYGTPPDYLRKIREIRMEYHGINKADYNLESLLVFLAKYNFELVRLRRDSTNCGNLWLRRSPS